METHDEREEHAERERRARRECVREKGQAVARWGGGEATFSFSSAGWLLGLGNGERQKSGRQLVQEYMQRTHNPTTNQQVTYHLLKS